MKKILAILLGIAAFPVGAEVHLQMMARFAEEQRAEQEALELQEAELIQDLMYRGPITPPVLSGPTPLPPGHLSPRATVRQPTGQAAPQQHRAVTNAPRAGAVGVRQVNQPAGQPGASRAVAGRAGAAPQVGQTRTPAQARSPNQQQNIHRAAVAGQVQRVPAGQAARPAPNRAAASQNRVVAAGRAGGIARSATAMPARPIAANANMEFVPAAATNAGIDPMTARAATNNAQDVNTARAVSLTGPALATTRGSVMRPLGSAALFSPTAQEEPVTISPELQAQADLCKAQYMFCMDQFCNVLDDNQGRCSCSASVERYAEAEQALADATIRLQEVANQIRLLGLSRDEIESMFRETEAEEALRLNQPDNTAMAQSLRAIEDWLVNPTEITTTNNTGFNFFDFTELLTFSTGFDLSMFMNTNTGSIKNQRGRALFDTATERCRNVIAECQRQGIDRNLIINSYDLEIDKQCVVYERSLTDANDQMRIMIRNATNVLQQVRLMVAQDRNRYDLRGCVQALDTCMQDEFVCGRNYSSCLDMTGNFFVNGAIVLGSNPRSPDMNNNWAYGCNAGGGGCTYAFNQNGSIVAMIRSLFSANTSTGLNENDRNLARMLLDRIGVVDDQGRPQGMCSSVLAQCQNHTFRNNAFVQNNEVTREFLQRTLMVIRARQDEILSNYSATCRQDIVNCLSRNSFNENNVDTPVRSCMPHVSTCISVLELDPTAGVSGICPNQLILRNTGAFDTTTGLFITPGQWVCQPPPVACTIDDIPNGVGISGFRPNCYAAGCTANFALTSDGRACNPRPCVPADVPNSTAVTGTVGNSPNCQATDCAPDFNLTGGMCIARNCQLTDLADQTGVDLVLGPYPDCVVFCQPGWYLGADSRSCDPGPCNLIDVPGSTGVTGNIYACEATACDAGQGYTLNPGGGGIPAHCERPCQTSDMINFDGVNMIDVIGTWPLGCIPVCDVGLFPQNLTGYDFEEECLP